MDILKTCVVKEIALCVFKNMVIIILGLIANIIGRKKVKYISFFLWQKVKKPTLNELRIKEDSPHFEQRGGMAPRMRHTAMLEGTKPRTRDSTKDNPQSTTNKGLTLPTYQGQQRV